MHQNTQDSLFFNATDINIKSFSVNKKYVVSIRNVNSVQTEIKTILGDVFLTKDFNTEFIMSMFQTIEQKNEEGKLK